jgi:hypothetical protein
MSKPPGKKAVAKEPSPIPGFLVACVLIGLFTHRLTVPAHEGALMNELILTMVFDAAMVVGLVAMSDPSSSARPASRAGGPATSCGHENGRSREEPAVVRKSGVIYVRAAQARWMRRPASSSRSVAVA